MAVKKDKRGGQNKAKLAGRKFGLLTALRPVGRNKQRNIIWECECECGNKHCASTSNLLRGAVRSCGCLPRGLIKHGHATNGLSRTYVSWSGMIQRCHNPKNAQFRWYGGANPPVTVCARWRGKDGFLNFLADMKVRPPNKMLSRLADTGPYTKSNCAWHTSREQGIEKRKKFERKKAA
jgi:hypothetical protein